jgi:hypothetical protein
MPKSNPPPRSERHAWSCILAVFLLGGVGCATTDQQVKSSELPNQTTAPIGSIVQIDPPAVVNGAGLVAAAPATVPKTAEGVRGGTKQSRRLLFKDLEAGSSVHIDVDTQARYITPVAGAADRDRLAVLIRTCSDAVDLGEIVDCGNEAFGVVLSDRRSDSKASVLPLPAGAPSDTFRGLAVDGDRFTTVRISLAEAMGDGSFDPSNIPAAKIDVLVSSGGEPFRPVASIASTGIEPCVTSDGAVWNIDLRSGAVSRFDPASSAWAVVPALAAKPLSTLACGVDHVALLDSQAHTLSLIDTASISTVVPLQVPDSVWGTGTFAVPTTSVRFDAVTSTPFVAVPASATPGVQLVQWDADGTPRGTRSMPGFESWLPFANDKFWRTAGDQEAQIVEVEEK